MANKDTCDIDDLINACEEEENCEKEKGEKKKSERSEDGSVQYMGEVNHNRPQSSPQETLESRINKAQAWIGGCQASEMPTKALRELATLGNPTASPSKYSPNFFLSYSPITPQTSPSPPPLTCSPPGPKWAVPPPSLNLQDNGR